MTQCQVTLHGKRRMSDLQRYPLTYSPENRWYRIPCVFPTNSSDFRETEVYVVRTSTLYTPDRLLTSQSKLYSTIKDYVWQTGTVRQVNDPLLLGFPINMGIQ